jgi:NAD(P)-dependent dehydrogenase (short-subunit alcohol dehydrogenase family)
MHMADRTVALVTGGGGGIGAACARKLCQDHIVVVVDANKAAAEEVAHELDGRAFECDISSESAVEGLVERVEAEIGPIEKLAHVAGIIQDLAYPPEKFDQDKWDLVQTVNVRGTWLSCRAVGSRMTRRKRGSIVNIASIAGHRGWPTHSYASSKAAVLSLTRGLAVEWGRSGIRVNSVSPGFTLTPKLEILIRERGWDDSKVAGQTALGRWVRPDEIADAVDFLLSDRASAITGADLPVDTGWLCGVNWLAFDGIPASR